MSIFEFDDQQGVRTRGTLRAPGATPGDVLTVGTSRGTVTPSPGGGSSPVQADYAGNPVNIADGDFAQLTWDTLVAGTDLLNRTDPANPVFLALGTYAVCVSIALNASAMSPGGYMYGNIRFGPGNINMSGTSLHPEHDLGLCFVQVVTVDNMALETDVTNFDGGAQAYNFVLQSASIVKLA